MTEKELGGYALSSVGFFCFPFISYMDHDDGIENVLKVIVAPQSAPCPPQDCRKQCK